MGPEGVADAGEDIGEGRMGFAVPSGPSGAQGTALLLQEMSGQDEPEEEAQQGRGVAGDGLVRPLRVPSGWGLDTQMSAHFLKGNLHLPTAQVPGEDRGRRPVGVGVEQRLGLLVTSRVAQEHPA